MSRNYNMLVHISDMNPDRVEVVQQAATEEWPFDDRWDWNESDNVLTASADDQLWRYK